MYIPLYAVISAVCPHWHCLNGDPSIASSSTLFLFIALKTSSLVCGPSAPLQVAPDDDVEETPNGDWELMRKGDIAEGLKGFPGICMVKPLAAMNRMAALE